MKNDFHQQFLRKAPFGFASSEIILDEDGKPCDYRFVEVNEAFEKLTGLKKENLLGRTLSETMPGIEKGEFDWLGHYTKTAKVQGETSFEYYSKTLSKWYEVQLTPENSGFLTSTFFDITDFRHKEVLLSEKAGLLQNITDNMFDIVAMCNPEGVFVFTGPTHHILGYGHNQLLGTSVFDYIHPDDLVSVEDAFKEVMSNPKPDIVQKAEYRYRCADGSYLWLETKGKILFDETNKPYAMFFNSRDISMRKQAETKLLENESNLEDIFQSVSEGICYSTGEGVVISVNDALVKMTGIQRNDIVGENIINLAGKFLPAVSAERSLAFINQLMNEEEIRPVEVELNNKVIEISATINKETKRLTGVLRDVTKRNQAEEALSKSEEFNRRLLTTIPDIVIRTELDGTITFVTEPGLKKYPGISASELIGKSMFSFIAAKDRQRNLENSRLMFEKQLGIQEYAIQISENHLIDCEVNGDVIRDSDHQPTGMVFVIRDISERKKAEENIRITKDTYQSIFNSVSEAIYVMGENGTFIDVNRGAELMYGYTTEELIGKSPETVSAVDMNNLSAVERIHEEVSETGISQSFEFWGQRKNGEIFPKDVIINKGSYFGKDCIIATARDITERKMTERALLKETRLQDILMKIASKYINIPLQTVEPAIQGSLEEIGHFVKADRVYIFDYLWGKGICKNTFEWCVEGVEPQIDGLQDVPLEMMQWWVDMHLKGETLYINDVFALDEKDGVRLILQPQGVKSLIAIPMMRDKECVGFVGFDSLKHHYEYSKGDIRLLEVFSNMLVNIGLRQEVEQNLIVAKNKAEAGDRLKSAFLNNISHEVRTPLNGILGFGQIITQTGLTQAEKSEYYLILQQSIDRLLNTITNYVDISLIVSGNLSVNKGVFSPNELLKSLCHSCKPECEAKELTLNIDLPDDFQTLKLNSDPELLRKALQHILNNAVQFTEKGSIEIRAELKETEICFTISDTGIGMESAFIDKVFDVFVQEDMRITRQYEGSGLGLSITKGFVGKLGGRISMESEKGRGTTVQITLPYEAEKDLIEVKPKPEAEKLPVKSPLVLIAEDEITNFVYLEVLLTKNNIRVLHAINGFEAVELCKQHPEINLVLMDIKMPVMDGLEATKHIKEFRPELPVIAITAYAQTGDEFRIREAGCDDYLAKPVKRAVLEKRLQKNGLLW